MQASCMAPYVIPGLFPLTHSTHLSFLSVRRFADAIKGKYDKVRSYSAPRLVP